MPLLIRVREVRVHLLNCRYQPRRHFERMSQKRRTSKKLKAKNIQKSCSYRQNENVPPDFKQYKTQGNASNLVQCHFGSPPWTELESGIAHLVPRGFDPTYWGQIQLPPSRYRSPTTHPPQPTYTINELQKKGKKRKKKQRRIKKKHEQIHTASQTT